MAGHYWLWRLKRWSVAVLGVVLLAAASLQVYLDDDLVLIDGIEVGMPAAVGLGLILGGIWLRQTLMPRRIARIAVWTLVGAVVGHAVNLWFMFIISLEQPPAGEPVVLNLNGAAIFMAACTGLGYYATGLRQREQELGKSEARFRALTENSPFAVITIDDTSTIRYANDAVADLFGYTASELVGQSLTTLMPERFHDGHQAGLAEHIASGERTFDWDGIELTAQHADGGEVPVEVSFGEYTADGTRLFTGVVHDISDRKAAEARFQDHAEKITQLHAIATQITAADSTDAIYQRTAEGAASLFDGDVARVSVIENDQLVPEASSREESLEGCDPLPVPQGYAGKSYQTGEIIRITDLTHTRSATASVTPTSSPSPLTREDGGTHTSNETDYRSLLSIPLDGVGVVQVFSSESDAFTERDKTVAEMLATHVLTAVNRVEAEATIRQERDRLDEFASVLSHDIRNPLNVAQGRLQLARGAADTEEQLDVVEQALTRIQHLIDDVLTLARQGELVGDTEMVSLERIAQQAWTNVATENAALQTDSLGRLEADRSRLIQMFENLYRNAIEHGGSDVTVTVGQMDSGFYVEDSGPGIPADERDQVFQHGHTTSASGTGYGLTIVKRIVDAHGWSITATDGSDGGARFEITDVQIPDNTLR